jgi:hypothetical protein
MSGVARKHIAAAGLFAALAVVWSFPLARHLSSDLPGSGIGDNVSFLWNFWWMRTALSSASDFFYTSYLFVPTGTDLTLNTHTALPAFVGATVLGWLPAIAAHNLTILVALFLNGFCAYLLAWRVTGDLGAAVIGGVVFGGCPYIAAHLHGHFNLTSAWTIPLFTIAVSEAIRGSTRWSVLAGVVLGATAYIDYYYVVFEIALALSLAAFAVRDWSIVLRGPGTRSRRLIAIVGAVALLDLAIIVAILATGGITAPIGPIRSARGIFNPLQAFWILVAVLLLLRLRPRVTARPRDGSTVTQAVRQLGVVAATFAVITVPLVWHAAGLLLREEYVTQRYFWRSAPPGVDISTLVLGNPFHPLWGGAVQRVYALFDIDAIETTAWFGIAPLVLVGWLVRRHARSGDARHRSTDPVRGEDSSWVVRQWAVIGLVFFLWALGPHLMAFGQNTAVILPQALLRFVPLLNNARIPGRAIVVTYLALSVLTAVAVSAWRATSRRSMLPVLLTAFAVIVDYLPAPFPVIAMSYPAVYDTLRDRPEQGAVCELPLGLRDGFGQQGMFDDAVLFYQMIHGRPLVGGVVSRLPRNVTAAYDTDPLLRGLLRLSAREELDGPLPDRQLATSRLRENGIRFIVLDRTRASSELIAYVERVLPLTLLTDDDGRSLYVVSDHETAGVGASAPAPASQ